MAIAIKQKDARLVIAANARAFADFVENEPAPGVNQFAEAVQQRYDDLGEYVKAFCETNLSIGKQQRERQMPECIKEALTVLALVSPPFVISTMVCLVLVFG